MSKIYIYISENAILAESPPDPLAFLITMAMVGLFFYGVRESVTVNHVLNVVNALTLAVILVVGMFYANPDNWQEFMPFGMTGVLRVSQIPIIT